MKDSMNCVDKSCAFTIFTLSIGTDRPEQQYRPRLGAAECIMSNKNLILMNFQCEVLNRALGSLCRPMRTLA